MTILAASARAAIILVATNHFFCKGMAKVDAFKCKVCSAVLTESKKRRVLHCSVRNAVSDVCKAFTVLVRPNFVPSSSEVSYVCRSPCFRILEKLHNHCSAINSLLNQLGCPLLSAWRQSESTASQTSLSDQVTQCLL